MEPRALRRMTMRQLSPQISPTYLLPRPNHSLHPRRILLRSLQQALPVRSSRWVHQSPWNQRSPATSLQVARHPLRLSLALNLLSQNLLLDQHHSLYSPPSLPRQRKTSLWQLSHQVSSRQLRRKPTLLLRLRYSRRNPKRKTHPSLDLLLVYWRRPASQWLHPQSPLLRRAYSLQHPPAKCR